MTQKRYLWFTCSSFAVNFEDVHGYCLNFSLGFQQKSSSSHHSFLVKRWNDFCVISVQYHTTQNSEKIYTSGQRYGITTTKWHLHEFDRYLLFLVVCSIAERNTVDFIDPLRCQLEWPKTVSIVWGLLRLKRRKKRLLSHGCRAYRLNKEDPVDCQPPLRWQVQIPTLPGKWQVYVTTLPGERFQQRCQAFSV